MTAKRQNWKSIQSDVLLEIRSKRWLPGEKIPSEESLAKSYGCSRTTINRALRELAQEGWIERTRKKGSFVSTSRFRKANYKLVTFKEEIENLGGIYSYSLLFQNLTTADPLTTARLGMDHDKTLFKVTALHLKDANPFVLEDRWINQMIVPDVLSADLTEVSANEWLVTNAPITSGRMWLRAKSADSSDNKYLGVKIGQPLFVMDRITFYNGLPVTFASFTYQEGYQLSIDF